MNSDEVKLFNFLKARGFTETEVNIAAQDPRLYAVAVDLYNKQVSDESLQKYNRGEVGVPKRFDAQEFKDGIRQTAEKSLSRAATAFAKEIGGFDREASRDRRAWGGGPTDAEVDRLFRSQGIE